MARKRVSLVSHQQPACGASRMPAPEFHAVLEAAQLSPTQRTAVDQRYGARAAAVLRTHPSRLVEEIAGISFQTADTIARKLGTGPASPARLRAGIHAVLHQAVRQGHTGLPMRTAIRRATRLLGVPRAVVEDYCLRSVLAGGGAFVVEQHGAETFSPRAPCGTSKTGSPQPWPTTFRCLLSRWCPTRRTVRRGWRPKRD